MISAIDSLRFMRGICGDSLHSTIVFVASRRTCSTRMIAYITVSDIEETDSCGERKTRSIDRAGYLRYSLSIAKLITRPMSEESRATVNGSSGDDSAVRRLMVRYLAPASFIYDFAAQQYGLFSSPNMLDIHNQNLAAFSPYPYFIGAFFFPQQIFQLVWLWKLWKQDGNAHECAMMNKFAWCYTLGNVCIGSMYTLEAMPQPLEWIR